MTSRPETGISPITEIIADFKAGRTPILVATEIAARGLDIDGLPHVVNMELPMVPEDYVHRIGRTGRAGSPGRAVSLVYVDERDLLRAIERVLGEPIPEQVVEGFEPDRSPRPEPILRGGFGRPPRAPGDPRAHGHHPDRRPREDRSEHRNGGRRRPEASWRRRGGRPGGRPSGGGPADRRPTTLPGERFARDQRR